MIKAYQDGRSLPVLDVAVRLCLGAGVSLDWLATGEGPVLMRERQVVAPKGPREFGLADGIALGKAIKTVRDALAGQAIDPEAEARLIGEVFRLNLRAARLSAVNTDDGDDRA